MLVPGSIRFFCFLLQKSTYSFNFSKQMSKTENFEDSTEEPTALYGDTATS